MAYRNARYTVVRARILKLIEEEQEIPLQDHGDECVRMESILSDSNMIHQNNTEEYGCVVGSVSICILLKIVRLDIISATFVGKNVISKLSAQVEPKLPRRTRQLPRKRDPPNL